MAAPSRVPASGNPAATPPASTAPEATPPARSPWPSAGGHGVTSRRRRLVIGGAVLAVLAAAAAVVLSVGFGRDPSAVRSVLINKPAPALQGTTLDGTPLNLSTYRGKIVMVNVWASWCAACRQEHPVLTAAQRTFASDGLQIVGVDMSDTVADAQKFLTEMGGAAYPSVQDPNAQLAITWGTFGVPETYVLDRSGVIRVKAVGPVTPDWIDAHVVPLLSKTR